VPFCPLQKLIWEISMFNISTATRILMKLMLTEFLPHREQYVSITTAKQLMLLRETVATRIQRGTRCRVSFKVEYCTYNYHCLSKD
jgi:hypothetical protein